MKLYNDNLIKKWESLELEAYLPTPNDRWTIGWGHTKTAKPGMKITKEKAQELFEWDTTWAVKAVNDLVKVPLTQNQFDSLVSLVFNIGTGNFKKSTVLRRLNNKNYEGAAQAMLMWNKQRNKKTGQLEVLRGLTRRRTEEMNYFLAPDNEEPAHNFLTEIPASDSLKPLWQSKETWGGVAAVLTGFWSGFGGLAPSAQEHLSLAVSGLLMAFGIYFIATRLWDRYKGER